EEGRIVADGPAHRVVGRYLNDGYGTRAWREWPEESAPGGRFCRLRAVRVHTEDGAIGDAMDIREPIGIDIEYDVLEPGHIVSCGFRLYNEDGIEICTVTDLDPAWRRRPRPAGRYVTTGWIPGNFLAEGSVLVNVYLSTLEPVVPQAIESGVAAFQVIDSIEGDTARGDWAGKWGGVVRPMLKWTTQYNPVEAGETTTVPSKS